MAVLTLLGLASLTSAARADGPTPACDQDPRCVGRELAVTLTAHSEFRGHEIQLPQLLKLEPGRVRVSLQSREKSQAIVEEPKRESLTIDVTPLRR